jgi:hypothetical protein
MSFPLIIAAALVAFTVTVHMAGFNVVIWFLRRSIGAVSNQRWHLTWLLIRMTWMLILFHVFEIMVWAMFYWQEGCLPDAESSLYFSGVTYTTLGYGDLVLRPPWRILSPVEALTGILMCGLSAALFFAVIARIYTQHLGANAAGKA